MTSKDLQPMIKRKKDAAIRVLLIANRTLIRLGIRTLLKGHLKIDRIDEVTPQEARLGIDRTHPHVIVLDLDDELGRLDLLQDLTGAAKGIGLVVLTGQADPTLVRAAYSTGAGAVVLKQYRAESLIVAIQKVLKGEVWMDRTMLDAVLGAKTQLSAQTAERPAGRIGSLTKRESDVVKAIVKGYRNKRIAEELGISEVTVRHHLTAIFSKLQVSDRLGLLIYAHSKGIAEIPPQTSILTFSS